MKKVRPDHPGRRAPRARVAKSDRLGRQERQVWRVKGAKLDRPGYRAFGASQDRRVLLDRRVSRAYAPST